MPTDTRTATADRFVDPEQQRRAATLGIWVFLATEVLFFGVLFASYTVNRLLHQQGFALGSMLTDVVLGTLNTAVLLSSSLTMALAVRAGMRGARRAITAWLAATLLLGVAFLAIKGIEYHKEYLQGLVPVLDFAYGGPDQNGVELFFYLYFVMTGLHALHLLVAVGVVAAMILMNLRGRFGSRYHTPLEVTGLYWHFVDIVWVFLYPLMYLVSRV